MNELKMAAVMPEHSSGSINVKMVSCARINTEHFNKNKRSAQ